MLSIPLQGFFRIQLYCLVQTTFREQQMLHDEKLGEATTHVQQRLTKGVSDVLRYTLLTPLSSQLLTNQVSSYWVCKKHVTIWPQNLVIRDGTTAQSNNQLFLRTSFFGHYWTAPVKDFTNYTQLCRGNIVGWRSRQHLKIVLFSAPDACNTT